jgi:hypothetical protein
VVKLEADGFNWNRGLAMLFYLAGGDVDDVGATFILFVLFLCVVITIAVLIIIALIIIKVLSKSKNKNSAPQD